MPTELEACTWFSLYFFCTKLSEIDDPFKIIFNLPLKRNVTQRGLRSQVDDFHDPRTPFSIGQLIPYQCPDTG